MQNYQNVLSNDAHHAQQPKGWTLVEVLVTTGIIGVLAALALPAVQQARDAARKVEEMNDLKQVGIAMHSFAGTHNGLLPAAVKRDVNTNQLVPWPVELLPHLDQAPLYNLYDRSKDPNDQSSEVLNAFVPALNRYDAGPDNSPGAVPGNRRPRGLSVMAISGDGVYKDPVNGSDQLPPSFPDTINTQGGFFPNDTGYNGLIPPHKQVNVSQVPAGLSNVALAIQHTQPNEINNRPYFNPFNHTRDGADQNGHYRHKSMIEHSPVLYYNAPPPGQEFDVPIKRERDAYFLENHTVTGLGIGHYDKGNVVANAYRGQSYHRDTTLVLYGDGHVKSHREVGAGATSDQSGLAIMRGLGNRFKGYSSDF